MQTFDMSKATAYHFRGLPSSFNTTSPTEVEVSLLVTPEEYKELKTRFTISKVTFR